MLTLAFIAALLIVLRRYPLIARRIARTGQGIVLLFLVPGLAYAEPFSVARDIEIPATLATPNLVFVELDAETRLLPDKRLRIISGTGAAVGFERIEEERNVSLDATVLAAPPAADTIPLTSVRSIHDGSPVTAFQPQTARTLTFRFRFVREATPNVFDLDLASGTLEGVTVRLGQDEATLRDAYVGKPSGNRIILSGERSRVAEVILTVKEGVLKIGEIQFLEPRVRLLFHAKPRQRYTLLSGPSYVENPRDESLWYGVSPPNVTTVQPGAPRGLLSTEEGDHDGVGEGDNCGDHWNVNQEDRDKDGVGDACDVCPSIANTDQKDTNRNGRGDACEDDDEDGVVNAFDNCPARANRLQEDEDKDGRGNICDGDDNRFTAGKDWILWASMAGIIVFLTGMGAWILRRTPQ